MNLRFAIAAMCAVAVLTGCQTYQSRYAWNNYRNQLYDYQAQKIDNAKMLEVLLGAENEATTRNVKMAPGLYAEIGTLYIRLNKPEEAPKYYRLEAETWPDSAPFMNALASNVEKMLKKGESK